MSKAYVEYYDQHIAGKSSTMLERLSYTLAARRSAMIWRRYAIVEAEGGTLSLPAMSRPTQISKGKKPSIAFVFTGQGAQYAGMGYTLMQYPRFSSALARANSILTGLGFRWSVFDTLRNEVLIQSPSVSQPLCTILQLALVDLLASFGVVPVAVAGHSSGEIAAAYAAGYLSFESACRVAYYRGEVAERFRSASVSDPGAMLAVGLSETQVATYITGTQVHVACINSPSNITLSGSSQSLDILRSRFDELGIFAQIVRTGVAYHSPAMESVGSLYLELMGVLKPGDSSTKAITMFSSVTGQPVAPRTSAQPQYWVDNLLSPVRFSEALQRFIDCPSLLESTVITDVIELGPTAALRRPVKDTVPTLGYHSMLHRSKSSLHTTLELVGNLFALGADIKVPIANGHHDSAISPAILTDSPPYPFNHSKRYWAESRISRDFRKRIHSPGYLVGRSAQDWNPLAPRWRNWMSTEAIPWLADHVVDSIPICPGTGMLVMAIEAVSALACSQYLAISGFLIRDAQFIAPLLVQNVLQDATEAVIELKPVSNDLDKSPTRFNVIIYSHLQGNWKVCFKADLQIQSIDGKPNQPAWANEFGREHDRVREQFRKAKEECSETIDSGSFYKFCAQNGLQYGPSFQLLENIHSDRQNTSIAHINIRSAQDLHGTADSPVHPAVLDAMLHLFMAPAVCEGSKAVSTPVPRRIRNLWISNRKWDLKTDIVHLLASERHSNSFHESKSTECRAIDNEGAVLCILDGLITTEVTKSYETPEEIEDHTLLHSIEWKPQLSFLNAHQLRHLCSANMTKKEDASLKAFYPRMESAMRVAVLKALKNLTLDDRNRASKTTQRFVAALEYQFGGPPQEGDDQEDEALEMLLTSLEAEQPLLRMMPAISRSLLKILRQEIDPLEILFKDNAAKDFYTHLMSRFAHDARLHTFLDLATHQNPKVRILEVGAGTGGMTRCVLDILSQLENNNSQRRFEQYVYTDISASFFEDARKSFENFADRMMFKKFDLESDPISQSFEQGGYDMIVAGSVLHATSDLNATLTNLRKLLKPGGYLILLEVTVLNSACSNVGFGSLDGWWLGKEEYRRFCPLLDVEQWGEALQNNGFSGADLVMQDFNDDSYHLTSVIISTSPGLAQNGVMEIGHGTDEIVLVLNLGSAVHHKIAQELVEYHPSTKIMDSRQLADSSTAFSVSSIIVFLLEFESPILASLDEVEFQTMKACIQKAENILWVSSPGNHATDRHPSLSVSTGFFRAIRNEQSTKHIVTLSLETYIPGTEGSLLSTVLNACFLKNPTSNELEYVVRDGLLNIGRAKEEIEMHEDCIARIKPTTVSEPWQSGPPVKLELGTLGRLDTLHYVADEQPELSPEEVEIETVAVPLSFRDIFIALGRLVNEELGLECAGVVRRVGTACSSNLQPGDRVITNATGCMRKFVRTPFDHVIKIPETIDLRDAVASMNPGMTTWHALVNIARLQRGEKVLIHAAAGSTGQMAVKIAKYLGAEVYVTVGSDAKKQLVINDLHVPEDHIFYSRDTSFAKGLMRVTNDYGVDVVINSLAGQGLLASWGCIAAYGRFVDISKIDIKANTPLPMARFAENVAYATVDLIHIARTDRPLLHKLAHKVLELIANEDFGGGPKPLHIYPVSDVQRAFRYMQSGENTGRIILDMTATNNVTVSQPTLILG